MFYLFACMVAAVGEPLLLQQLDQVLTDIVPEIHPFEVDAFDCFVGALQCRSDRITQ